MGGFTSEISKEDWTIPLDRGPIFSQLYLLLGTPSGHLIIPEISWHVILLMHDDGLP